MRRDPGILCRGLDVRGDETCHDVRDVVPRDADVFQLPVVKAMKRGGGLAAMPALDGTGNETCRRRAKTRTRT